MRRGFGHSAAELVRGSKSMDGVTGQKVMGVTEAASSAEHVYHCYGNICDNSIACLGGKTAFEAVLMSASSTESKHEALLWPIGRGWSSQASASNNFVWQIVIVAPNLVEPQVDNLTSGSRRSFHSVECSSTGSSPTSRWGNASL